MGEPRKLYLDGPVGRLEAMLRTAEATRFLALVCHPHPLFGGTLHNPVVFHSERELWRRGATTLRFNFRGVQGSEGTYDEGRGEVDDVAAAAAWLRGLAPTRPLLLVGYSFGSFCAAQFAARHPSEVAALIGIGLPLRNFPMPDLRIPMPLGAVQADRDEFATPEAVRAWLDQAHPGAPLTVLSNTEHLFPQRAGDVGQAVAALASSLLGAAIAPGAETTADAPSPPALEAP